MGVDGNAAEVLLGLPGFRLVAVSETGGEVEVAGDANAPTMLCSPARTGTGCCL